jgi:hypothetical protein
MVLEVADPQPLAVHGDGHDPEPGGGRGLAQPVPAGVLDGEGGDAGRPKGPAEAADPVGHAAADRHLRRVGMGAPHPGQVLGQEVAQPGMTGGVRIAELGVGQAGGHRPQGRHPAGQRERAQVGQAGGQVDARRPGRGDLRHQPAGVVLAEGSHPGAGADPALEVALGGQLGVGLGDDPA